MSQIGRGANAQGLPQGQFWAQLLAQLAAAFRRLIAVELHHLMAEAGPQLRQLPILRIGHHQQAAAAGVRLRNGGKQIGALIRGEPAGRPGHRDHADGLNAEAGHRRRLIGLAQTTHLQPGLGASGPGRGRKGQERWGRGVLSRIGPLG